MVVPLRHLEPVVEDAPRLSPFAEVQQSPRTVELAGHVVIGVVHLRRESQALLGGPARRPVLRLVTQKMRVVTDVQAERSPIARAPRGVDGPATRFGILVSPPAEEDALETTVAVDMSSQRMVVKPRRERERSLGGGQAPVSIDPGERAAELQQRARLVREEALPPCVVGERCELRGGGAHVALGPVDLPELPEEDDARAHALRGGQSLGDLEGSAT